MLSGKLLSTLANVALFACWGRKHALVSRFGLYVLRVPSKDNISDDPSREKYDLVEKVGAKFVEPVLAPMYANAQTWEALAITSWPHACARQSALS